MSSELTKKIMAFFVMFYLFIIVVNAREIYRCDNIKGLEGLCFDVTFAVTTDKEMKISSKYNFPHFIRAYDYLYIKNIKVYNLENNKTSNEGVFSLMIRPIDYIDKPYTDLKKTYPDDYGEFNFNVKSLPPKYYCEYSFNEEGYYKTTCKGGEVIFDRYNIELFKEGEWVIVDNFEPENKSLGSWGFSSFFNGRWKGNTFRVTSGFEMDNFKDLKTSLKIIFFTLMATIFVGLLQFYLGYRNLSKEKQKENRVLLFLFIFGILVFLILIIYSFI